MNLVSVRLWNFKFGGQQFISLGSEISEKRLNLDIQGQFNKLKNRLYGFFVFRLLD